MQSIRVILSILDHIHLRVMIVVMNDDDDDEEEEEEEDAVA
jgi:hypothetical protein